MTSKITYPCWIIGLMSGTSADGVDAAALFTDGRDIVEVGPSVALPYSDALRADILSLMKCGGNLKNLKEGLSLVDTAQALTQVHIEAVEKLRARMKDPVQLIGFHGQTIQHAPRRGITWQIGDPKRMAQQTRIPVIADFRSRDVREGGEGAPLVPLYQAALARDLPKPVVIVNIGGVANVTWLGSTALEGAERPASRSDQPNIMAFDCGPGNALMDDWFFQHTGQRFDEDGRIAARGKVDDKRLREFASDPFFALKPPKSLDRQHFSLDLVEGMSLEDGTATLAAMTAFAIAKACELVPELPHEMLVTGGGRHNVTLMQFIRSYCGLVLDSGFGLTLGGAEKKRSSEGAARTGKMAIRPIGDVGWDGDMLEAQAFAYLAARSHQGLALTLPGTTGVPRPVTGGVFYPALRAGGS